MLAAFLLCLTAAGCNYPMDVENTTEHVMDSGTLRSGLVAGTDDEAAARQAAQSVADEAGVQLALEKGHEEQLLRRLENGELDLVVGAFAKKSPWSKRVVLSSSPVAKDPKGDEPVIRSALRRGENRWYMLVEKAMKEDWSAGPARQSSSIEAPAGAAAANGGEAGGGKA